ncbi:acyl-CoA dehydrogenase [Sinisalibacter aestuarii]|uniref:Acyl-CoA dehydrogenase n=1 Tax=Sinisalibacter aestuarii TaxID=2949426 RepID=A0ABQ5LVV2_9RHOB|nr:acyl-CoA dehydrogenase [Sinisalibacter aestuarii]GKY89097.1 acyl-CoA dehydrogenase [Sinisalibacter aestuarii]
MPYRAPVRDFRFMLEHVVAYDQVVATERFADAGHDTVAAILDEAARLNDEKLAPLNRVGDTEGAVLENGVVRTAAGFRDGYAAIAGGGWVGIAGDPAHGGMGLPFTLNVAFNDMISGAALALGLNPLLSQGQIEALETHASDELKALYLPRLNSGDWTGTMNLTEPQAGSDVGALTTRAVPNGDGTYAITGQKIFISWGDHDFGGNVCHLVLARLPDAAPGTRGISLFMVPKFIPDTQGEPGARNALRVVSLEHKMGLHASPTCVMSFEGATGWLVGGENRGMAAMFTMMNNARLQVGVQGIGVAEGAYQHALAYAQERRQGRTPLGEGGGAIIDHADVRRMLIEAKAEIFAARAIALACGVALDMEKATGDPDWAARAALLTPVAKSFGTDVAQKVAGIGIQVHGGMGYIEETGAAQFARDARVLTIYEGTNGIQAMDLVGRKMMDGGEAAYRMFDEGEQVAEIARRTVPDLAEAVWGAAETLRECVEWLVEQDMQERFAGAVPFQSASARVLGAFYHLKAAHAEGGAGPRTALARYYIERLLPEYEAFITQAKAGAAGLYALSAEDLAS